MTTAYAADAAHLIRVARKVCRRAGFPVDADPEYDSAINYAVCLAVAKYKPGKKSLCTTACDYAIHKCIQARKTIARWRRQDAAGASRPQALDRGRALLPDPFPIAIPLLDRQVLDFVAAQIGTGCPNRGRSRAARLLQMTRPSLDRLLDDIFLRNPSLLSL